MLRMICPAKGDCHARPRRPRPALWYSARMASPFARAVSRISALLVESVTVSTCTAAAGHCRCNQAASSSASAGRICQPSAVSSSGTMPLCCRSASWARVSASPRLRWRARAASGQGRRSARVCSRVSDMAAPRFGLAGRILRMPPRCHALAGQPLYTPKKTAPKGGFLLCGARAGRSRCIIFRCGCICSASGSLRFLRSL